MFGESESKSILHNNAVLIKDCTFLELFLFEPKSGAKYNALLIINDWIIDLLKFNGTLLLDKKLEKENNDFLNFSIHISDNRFKRKIITEGDT